MYDIIIAGGGPAGLFSARLCKDLGLDYIVLEEHKEIGKPNHCSGLVSTNLEKFVEMDDNFIEHKVRGCILHSKNSSVRLTKPKTAAYVIDREMFDRHLSRDIAIEFNTHVEDFSVRSDKVTVKTNKGEIDAKILLACDGSNSIIRRKFGLKPKEMLTGLIAIKEEINFGDHVELWFDRKKLRDGFFWKIPRGKTTEYGMLGKTVNFNQLEDLFNIRDYEKRAGVINFGPVKSYSERLLLIGDSACQVKPWSGGGVIYGLKCAEIAVQTLKEAFEQNDFSERFLSRYEKQWKKTVGKQIKFGMIYRNLYRKTSNSKIDLTFSLMKKLQFLNKLDMDLL